MTEGFFGGDMEIRQGYSYHIKDNFFLDVNDSSLMSNKEGGNYRPHYYAIEDSNDKELRSNLKKAIAITRSGHKVFYTDIDRVLEVIRRV